MNRTVLRIGLLAGVLAIMAGATSVALAQGPDQPVGVPDKPRPPTDVTNDLVVIAIIGVVGEPVPSGIQGESVDQVRPHYVWVDLDRCVVLPATALGMGGEVDTEFKVEKGQKIASLCTVQFAETLPDDFFDIFAPRPGAAQN